MVDEVNMRLPDIFPLTSDELKHEVFVYKLKDIVAKDPTIEAVHAVARAEVLYGKSPIATFKNMCKIVTDIQKRLGVTPKHAGMQGIHLRSKTSYYSRIFSLFFFILPENGFPRFLS